MALRPPVGPHRLDFSGNTGANLGTPLLRLVGNSDAFSEYVVEVRHPFRRDVWGLVGADRCLEAQVAQRYEKHFARRAFALAARVNHRDAPQTRGIFIESGAFDIRNVEGSFVAKKSSADREGKPDRRGNSPAQQRRMDTLGA